MNGLGRWKAAVFAAAALAPAAVASPGFAGEPPPAGPPVGSAARITAMTWIDTARGGLDDRVEISCAIRNDSSGPIYVPGRLAWGFRGGCVLRLWDERGQEIEPIVRDTLPPPPPIQAFGEIMVRLRPGHFLGIRRTVPFRHLVERPGIYKLSIEYRSPVFHRITTEVPEGHVGVWHEDGSVFSPHVTFTVTDVSKASGESGPDRNRR
jgi:hypothetical protein